MAKIIAAHTGPVMTLLDLVVHVPVNCGSVCADTKEKSTTPTVSDDRSNTIMECGRWKVNRIIKTQQELTELGDGIF